MTVNDRLDSFMQQAKALFPGDSFSADIEKNLRALAQSAFSKLDMVSKEEFDAQVAVLHRSREKIDQLEQQLAELSEQLK
ncbi:accessory factor UbiK family protein [Oceanicoccus sp. KOV_DT_Chl]|uniref:accessory factor UbiK family protein n=1 Tax=Oceanicoccus sp. KOV_DT_Chl TaxID=1904639 RepID=UPI000C7B4CEF|nr:accessory factor UbiK family protein [Oceanicoccus sp. KOV_DT_Chl]